MKKIVRITGIVLLVAAVIIQLIPVNKEVPNSEVNESFIAITQPPEDVKQILTSACMDCHSYQTQYPWYSSVAPINFWIQDHVEEGREHLNFSAWGSYSEKKRDHKLEEFIEEVEEAEMPLNSYTWMHGEAKLSSEQIELLVTWVKEVRESGKF